VKGVRLVRPLLEVSRAEIIAYLRREKLTWREDESNADPVYLRNRVRHELIPQLERDFNPRIRETLSRTRRILSAEEDWLDQLTGHLLKECLEGRALGCRLLQAHPLAARRRVIRKWLIQQKAPESCLDFETVERIISLSAQTGGSKTLLLGDGRAVRRAYDRLTIIRETLRGPVGFRVRLQVPGVTVLPEQGWRVVARLEPGLIKDRAVRPGHLPARASLHFTGGKPPVLWVRSWRPGDKIAPFGMKGTKKIQDILVDAKVPQNERLGLPIFESGGEIVWLPGYRVAAPWAVKDPSALNLQLSMEKVL
jgi:tRNA(Ile)-lysidine synthase